MFSKVTLNLKNEQNVNYMMAIPGGGYQGNLNENILTFYTLS